MKKTTVLVTGAGGYVGRHVVESLINLGMDVIATDIHVAGIDKRAALIEKDIFSEGENFYNFFHEPDLCIHLAWRNGFVHNNISHIEDLSKHYIFLKNMVESGLSHLSVMGTMHEVGYWEGAIDENTPCNPSSLYGISKNALRQLCFSLQKDNPNLLLQWLRAYYIVGDDSKNHSIFSKISDWELEGKTTFPFTSGKNKYDFIDVRELGKQIAAASIQENVTGIINCCNGNPISLREKVMEFIEINSYHIRPEYGAFPDREYDSPAVWGDNRKIKQILQQNGN